MIQVTLVPLTVHFPVSGVGVTGVGAGVGGTVVCGVGVVVTGGVGVGVEVEVEVVVFWVVEVLIVETVLVAGTAFSPSIPKT